MKALSLYQQAILTEMGITQWQLRTLSDSDDVSVETSVAANTEVQDRAEESKPDTTPAKTLDSQSAANILADLKASIKQEAPEQEAVEQVVESEVTEPEVETQVTPSIELTDLSGKLLLNMSQEVGQSELVNDVLQVLDLEPGLAVFITEDIQHYHQQTFSWLVQQTDKVTLEANTLITPEINKLANSPELKQQLWLLLSRYP